MAIGRDDMQISLSGYQCLRCGHRWKPRSSASGTPPKKCPKCDSASWRQPPGEKLPPHLKEVFLLYEVPQDQRADIICYASQHPGVAQTLLEAAPELEKVFGRLRRRLELEVDPESGWEELLGIVLLKEYPENAFELMDPFDKAFLLRVPREVRFHLNFTIAPEDDYPI